MTIDHELSRRCLAAARLATAGGGLKTWRIVVAATFFSSVLSAADLKAPASYDPAFVEQILRRLDAQEKELKELRAAKDLADSAPRARVPNLGDEKMEEPMRRETFPKLAFHGFGDFSYVWDSEEGERRNRFALGQLDLFVTSQLADNFSILSENVIEADSADNFVFEIERLILQWSPSDYFNLSVGRYHTALGYYNAAYHHGTWFQTATGRPGFLDFEDDGGLIAAHNVGVSVNGRIPSGKLGLHYIAEMGNGRRYNHHESDRSPVLNVSDDNDYKAVNLALLARPEWVSGLQVGAGVYFDRLTPDGHSRIDELTFHAHAVYKSGPWEFLSEAYSVRHSPQVRGARTATTRAVFTQLARKFGDLTPYARFSFIDAPDHDAVWQLIGSNGRRYGPGLGLRWDFSDLAAVKAQYDFERRRDFSDLSTFTLQTCFTY